MINENGTKFWMDIYGNPTDSKRHVPFTSDNPRHFLRNMPFSIARRICAIVENESVTEQGFKELKKAKSC